MIQRSAPAFPEALDDDDDDVTWALQTAGVQWKRGAHADAIEWLHRAVESAVDGGRAIRAREIQQQANGLEAALKSGWRPSAPAVPPPRAQRNPFLSESADLVHDPYGELAVDIDMESSFQLRSRLPTSALPQQPAAPFSSPAEDVSDEDLIEEVEEFEDDDDAAALAAPRMPFVSTPTLDESLEDDDFVEPEPDGELPTLPPSVRGLAPPGRRLPSVPPRPPNLPPTPSWPPPPASNRSPTLPPASVPPPSSEFPPSVPPISERPPSLPPSSLPPQVAAWQQPSPPSSRPPSVPARPRNRASVPKISSSPPLRSPANPAQGRSPAPPSPPPPPARNRPVPPRPPSVAAASRGAPVPDSVAPRQPRSNRRPSARALALEQKIAAAKALARQRRLEAGLTEEESTEPAAEIEPVPSSSVPLRSVSSHPPDTIVSSPPESFGSIPPEETTERDIEPQREAASLANIPRDSAPVLSYGELSDYDPNTSPSLASPFANRESVAPASQEPQSVPAESAPAPSTESEPSLPPSSPKVSDSITVKHDLTAELAAIMAANPGAFASDPPESRPPESAIPDSIPIISEAPQSAVPISIPMVSDAPQSAVPISIPMVSAAPSAVPISIPMVSAAPSAEAPTAIAEAPEPAPPAAPRATAIGGIELGWVPGLEDLPEESQQDLVAAAEVHELGADEEVSGFELALVLEGAVAVMPSIADVAAARAGRGELIFSEGHLDPGLPLRVVASQAGTKVASFSKHAFEAAVRDCPWVGDELKSVGDRLQTLAGVALGPMGEELDDMLRGLIVQHCEVRRFLPNEVIAPAGKTVPGMVIVGAGRIELVDAQSNDVVDELGPGSFLFASQILQAAPAPQTARAGEEGALALFAERRVAHELMVSVPPLLGIFAR